MATTSGPPANPSLAGAGMDGKKMGETSKHNPQHDAHKEGNHLGMVQIFQGIAKPAGDWAAQASTPPRSTIV